MSCDAKTCDKCMVCPLDAPIKWILKGDTKPMITLSKEIYTGIIKWNGNHYFTGDIAKGYLVIGAKNGTFINHQWEDLFGNTWGDTLEVEADSLKLLGSE